MSARNVAILLFGEVEVLDFAGPFEVFSVTAERTEPTPFAVYTVAETDAPIRAVGGLRIVPEHALSSAPAPDILVVPGGVGSRQVMSNNAVVGWVREVAEHADLVMSVCTGALILANAGLLAGRRVTTHHDVFDALRTAAPDAEVITNERFIDAGDIITTGGISAGIDGSFHVVARLLGEDVARDTAVYMEYDGYPRTATAYTMP